MARDGQDHLITSVSQVVRGLSIRGHCLGSRSVAVVCACGHTGLVTPVLRASLVATLLAGVLAAGGCSSSPSCGNMPCPYTVTTRLMYVVTVNGRSASLSRHGIPPSFRVRSGQHLHITVVVTVPRHATVTALSLGISAKGFGGSPQRPIGVRPILARSGQQLATGRHTFGLRWRIPEDQLVDQPGASLDLVSVWSTSQGDDGQSIATLALPPAP